jgi:D-alanyl-D-alanine carboxypeptidase (penicillin-binding protein 5/6)
VGGARLLARGLVAPADAPAVPQSVTAQAWILVDLDSGDVLAARDPHGRYQPASILKTLTAVTLLPLLPGRRVVTVSNAAATAEGSHAGLVAGGRYTVDELFSGLLLVSGNDTAAALADAAGGYAHTVQLMNQKALQLGAYDTYVQTPSGLDGWQQLTSAYDMALVLRAAVAQPRFVRYDRQPTGTLPWQKVNGYGPVTLDNQNTQFLTSVPGALVAKTGFTDAAQHTFVGAIARHGRRLGVVMLRAQRWPSDQWQQATDLMDWGFALPRMVAAVGHLDAPVTAMPATSTPAPSTTQARRVTAAALSGGTASARWLWLSASVAAAAALAGGLTWRRRRTR